jgi:hypothetical protein
MSHVYPSLKYLENVQIDLRALSRDPVNTKVHIFHEKLKKYNIPVEISIDEKKTKKKTKQEMIHDMEQIYERAKATYDTQLSDLSMDFETREFQCLFPKIIFKTKERSIKIDLLKTDDPKKYLLQNFSLDPMLYHFGSFLMLCKSCYVIDKNDQLLECFPYISKAANPYQLLYIDIPNQISECLYCAPSFYGILGYELLSKKKECSIEYEEDFDINLIIHSIPLALHDKFIVQRFGNLNEYNEDFSFEMNYVDFMKEYYLFVYIHIQKNEHNLEHNSKHKFIVKPYFDKEDLVALREYLLSLENILLLQPSLYMKNLYNDYQDKIYVKKNNELI